MSCGTDLSIPPTPFTTWTARVEFARRATVSGVTSGVPFTDEQQLAEIRAPMPLPAAGNEFAINGHENRISYIVGSGHVYKRRCKKGSDCVGVLLTGVQSV